MEGEEWKAIKGFETYSVSNFGRVRNNETLHILKPFPRSYQNHYLGVDLYRGGTRYAKRVHRLVAQAFIPNVDYKPEVNHKDCNPHNNRVGNLEWCTRKENEAHKRFMEIKV